MTISGTPLWSRNVTPMMYRRKSGSRSMIWSAMSLNAAFRPDTYATASLPAVAAGNFHVVPQAVDELARLLVLRRGCGFYEDDPDRLRVVVDRLVNGCHALQPRSRS